LPVARTTRFGGIPISVPATKRGAVGLLPKPFRDQEMLDAMMAAIARDLQRRYVDTDASKMRQRFGTLPAREQQARPLVTPAR
jgi:FixJ family two-component response regulator